MWVEVAQMWVEVALEAKEPLPVASYIKGFHVVLPEVAGLEQDFKIQVPHFQLR